MFPATWMRFRQVLAQFRTKSHGGALVEAALILPIGILLFIGISEFAQGFTINRRLEAAAGTAADLVTRQPTINTSELIGIKTMLDEIVKPYPVSTLSLRITSILTDDTTTATVGWSFAQGPDITAHATGASLTVPTGLVGPNSSIVLTEIRYAFSSSLSLLIPAGIPLRAKSFFPPRDGGSVERAD